MNKNVLIGAVVVVALGAFWAFKPVAPAPSPVPQGALSSPDIQTNWFRIGGVGREYRRSALATATTTPCALQSPAATSTIISTAVQVTTASSTATTWVAAISANAFATTTQLKSFSLSSGALGTMFITSTTTWSTDAGTTLSPNTWIVWSRQGTVESDTSKLNGVCEAEFLVI